VTVMYDLAADTLEEATRLLDPNVTGRSLPARRYVSHGQPPVEFCDGLLAVWLGPLDTVQVGQAVGHQTRRVITMSVDVWRCWPTGDSHPVPPEDLSNVSLMLADDLDRLTVGLSGWLSSRCGPVSWSPAQSLGPNGGMAGWRLSVGVGI